MKVCKGQWMRCCDFAKRLAKRLGRRSCLLAVGKMSSDEATCAVCLNMGIYIILDIIYI